MLWSVLQYMTDGMLLREAMTDQNLMKYDTNCISHFNMFKHFILH